MRYYYDMIVTSGFDDGEAVPADAYACRQAYIRGINAFAEDMGSNFRADAYDRPGLHNPCMIVVRPVDGTVEQAILTEQPRDAAFTRALEIALRLDLDSFVHVEVAVREDELTDFLVNVDVDVEV